MGGWLHRCCSSEGKYYERQIATVAVHFWECMACLEVNSARSVASVTIFELGRGVKGEGRRREILD